MNVNVLFSGFVSGVMYALAGVSLVIVYRASRLVNFALGGMGGLAAYVAYEVSVVHLPTYVGYVAAIATGAAIGLLTDVLVVRRSATGEHGHIVGATSTLGVLLLLEGVSTIGWGTELKTLHEVFGSNAAFTIGSLRVSANDIYIVVVAAVVLAAVYFLLFRTMVGLKMRAVAQGSVTSALVGINVRSISLMSWSVGGAAGAIAALLIIPTTNLEPDSFTNFLFFAFAAVVLGGLTSITGVAVGGIVFGVAINLIEYYLSTALTDTISLIVVTVILLLRPNGILGLAEPVLPVTSGLSATGFGSGQRERSLRRG